MNQKVNQLLSSLILFVVVAIAISLTIEPFSITSYVGPLAGLATAIVVVWGSISLISVIVGTIIIHIYLTNFLSVEFDVAIVLISLLATLLQAFFGKQLTYMLVQQQNWLASRANLIEFIIKIGPYSSIVSGVSALLVSVLTIESFDSSIFYIFITGWAGSLLVAIFLTPAILFTQGVQHLKVSKRFFVVIASVLACISIGLLFNISQQQAQHQREDRFERASSDFIKELEGEIQLVSMQINALSSLFKASDFVNKDEFYLFSSHIFQPHRSIRALEWVPVVSKNEISNFEEFASETHQFTYEIVEQYPLSKNEQAEPYSLPVFYIYPEESNQSAYGLDLSSHKAKRLALQKAILTNNAIASAPLTLIQDNVTRPGMLVFKSIFDAKNLNSFGVIASNKNQQVSGFVVAVVQFDKITSRIAENYAEHIKFSIKDVSNNDDFIVYGSYEYKTSHLQQQIDFSVFGRKWQIDVVEQETWVVQDKSWQTWSLLIGGTVGGFLFQLLILMMAAYSTELSFKVGDKTRKLILAKEHSEQENSSKTLMLQTLTNELKQPLNDITTYVKYYQSKTLDLSQRAHINQLAVSTDILEQIANSVDDLSQIEGAHQGINNSVFEFNQFLESIVNNFSTNESLRGNRIRVIAGKGIPHFITTDKERLEKMLLALQFEVSNIFVGSDIQMSIKPHFHQKYATLFFTCSALEDNSELDSVEVDPWLDQNVASYSTRMALIKEICLLLGGDIKLSKLPSGAVIINSSIKVMLNGGKHSIRYESLLPSNNLMGKKKIFLVEEALSTNYEVSTMLLKLNYQVEIIDDYEELKNISCNDCDLLVIDNVNSLPSINHLKKVIQSKNDEEDYPPILGMYRGIEWRQLPDTFKAMISQSLLYPIEPRELSKVIQSLLEDT